MVPESGWSESAPCELGDALWLDMRVVLPLCAHGASTDRRGGGGRPGAGGGVCRLHVAGLVRVRPARRGLLPDSRAENPARRAAVSGLRRAVHAGHLLSLRLDPGLVWRRDGAAARSGCDRADCLISGAVPA